VIGILLGVYPGLTSMLPAFAGDHRRQQAGGAAIGALVVGLPGFFGKALFPEALLHAADGLDPGDRRPACRTGRSAPPMSSRLKRAVIAATGARDRGSFTSSFDPVRRGRWRSRSW
jgi:hypothetical protein